MNERSLCCSIMPDVINLKLQSTFSIYSFVFSFTSKGSSPSDGVVKGIHVNRYVSNDNFSRASEWILARY